MTEKLVEKVAELELGSGDEMTSFHDNHCHMRATFIEKTLIPIIRKAVELKAYEKGLADGEGEKIRSVERAVKAERDRILNIISEFEHRCFVVEVKFQEIRKEIG